MLFSDMRNLNLFITDSTEVCLCDAFSVERSSRPEIQSLVRRPGIILASIDRIRGTPSFQWVRVGWQSVLLILHFFHSGRSDTGVRHGASSSNHTHW